MSDEDAGQETLDLDGQPRSAKRAAPASATPATEAPKAPPRSQLPDYTTLTVFRDEVQKRMYPLDLGDCIVELEREIRMRETHYPRFVEQGKVTQKAASLQLARMRAARMVLLALMPARAS